MSIQGDKKLIALFKRLGPNTVKRLRARLYAASDEVKTEARLSITRGSVSGKGHIASKPGEPPKRDTGHLDTNITNRMTGPLAAETKSEAGYGAALEFGTAKMMARPYMRPAVKKVLPKFRRDIVAQTVLAVKESKNG